MNSVRYGKAIAAFSLVVIVFLAIADSLLLDEERGTLVAEYAAHSRAELELMGALTREDLLRQDYAAVETQLHDWSVERGDVVELTATAANGFVLAHYRRGRPAARSLALRHTVSYAGEELLNLEVVRDQSTVFERLQQLAWRLIIGSILLTALLAAVVWFTIHRTALKPLETEIARRERAEGDLIRHRDRLDDTVTERTRELTQANQVLKQEIAGRQRIEGELRASHEHNRLLLESAGEGICGMDSQGKCTFVNKAALDMLGYRHAEMVGHDLHALIHHSHADGSPYTHDACPSNRVLHDGKGSRIEGEVFWRKDGTPIPVEYSSHPIAEGSRVTGVVVVFRDVTEARALAEQLTFQACHDMLTGLNNRLEFERRLERVLKSGQQDPTEHALLYLDLDQFKVINDTCGHAAGDELLRQVASLLKTQIRLRDTLARLGGDEFGVLLEHCPLEQARRVAEDILNAINEFRFSWDDRTFSVGVSIGVVTIDDLSGNLTGVLAAADTACYAAKEAGRNRMHIYQAEDVDLARRQGEMSWVSRIQLALAEDRLVLYAQPIKALGPVGGHRHFYEILLRMRDENSDRLILPAEFLPAAERFDLMPAIDRWVVHSVLKRLQALPREIQLSSAWTINLSGASVSDDDFLDYVRKECLDAHLPPDVVHFEITETSAVTNLSKVAHFIRDLKVLGCRFALDDFGSGMSSFAYLKNLPVDIVKIDGAFVRDILTDELDFAMVRSINEIVHLMGMQTVAEFVESQGIAEKLRPVGVDFAQGFGIQEPVPLEQMERRCKSDWAAVSRAVG